MIFSTNMPPGQLMDPAFLRRIPYKIEVEGPCPAAYRRIFRGAATSRGIQEVPDGPIDFVVAELTERNGFPLAAYQPGFLVDQVLAACRYLGVPPRLDRDLLAAAIGNLYTRDSPGYGMAARVD